MGKAKMYGAKTTYVPNSQQRRKERKRNEKVFERSLGCRADLNAVHGRDVHRGIHLLCSGSAADKSGFPCVLDCGKHSGDDAPALSGG